MRNVLTGESFNLVVDFIEDGVFVSPDQGSVRYVLRDKSGQPISGHINVVVPTTAGQTSAVINIPGDVNTNSAEFETRTIHITYLLGGRTLSQRFSYRVHNWLPYTATEAEVRAFTGLSATELPDQEIDLVSAYLHAKEDLPDLNSFLQTGDLQAVRANRAIICHAVLALAHSFQMRALQSQGSETARASRFANINWNQIAHQASSELGELNQKLSNSLASSLPLFTLTGGIDPITGA